MKYLFRIGIVVAIALGFAACDNTSDFINPNGSQPGDMQVNLKFSLADKAKQTRSIVSGEETVVTVMQLVCFDADGKYVGIRNAEDVTSNGASGSFFDTGEIKGTVPQGTSRIHFIANSSLTIPLLQSTVGMSESEVMNSMELSTTYDKKICYWGYHKEANADAMSEWLKPAEGSNHIVYLIRDRARVVLDYTPSPDATAPVTKIEWLIHNGHDRGYIAPAEDDWSNDGYYANSTAEGHTSDIISIAGIHEYKTSGRYSLWTSDTENEDDNFDLAYQSTGTYTSQPQYLFDDDNADADDVKVILKVTDTVDGSPKTVYHTLRLNDDDRVKYDIVRNNTYYINCKLLTPDVAAYETLKDAIEGEEFVNADVEVDRTIPDINDDQYTLQIKLPTETTSIVLNTEGEHNEMHFVYRLANDVNTTGSTDPNDFNVYWEKAQTFCSNPTVTYDPLTKQFEISTTVLEGQLTDHLQDQWIVVENKTSKLKRYIHVYVIDQFRYQLDPTLTKVGNDYLLQFQLPPMEHTQFLEDGSGDPDELIYPETLYPIDVKFTTNTLNAYGTTQGATDYGQFGVSVESTSQLCTASNFEPGYNSPISSTNYNADRTHWYYQQENNYWDFWYTYQLKTCPENGMVKIYFKDVRDHITYATVADVGLFLYVEYFGKNYSVPLSQ